MCLVFRGVYLVFVGVYLLCIFFWMGWGGGVVFSICMYIFDKVANKMADMVIDMEMEGVNGHGDSDSGQRGWRDGTRPGYGMDMELMAPCWPLNFYFRIISIIRGFTGAASRNPREQNFRPNFVSLGTF